jgi:hypothetical protein
MKSAYDETLATALKRQHEPQRFVGDLLKAEISEKQVRSIRYQLTIAKLPLAKDVDASATGAVHATSQFVRDLIATAPVLRFTLGRRPGRAGSSMVRAGRS